MLNDAQIESIEKSELVPSRLDLMKERRRSGGLRKLTKRVRLISADVPEGGIRREYVFAVKARTKRMAIRRARFSIVTFSLLRDHEDIVAEKVGISLYVVKITVRR